VRAANAVRGKIEKDLVEVLTFFPTAKPFRDRSGIIQRNALKRWTLLHPEVEVILFGDDDGAGRERLRPFSPSASRAQRAWNQAGRVLRFDLWHPVWFLLSITRPLRNVLGLRAQTIARSREKV
jgi:hypothetical protein